MRLWAQKLGAQRIIAVGDRCTDIQNAREAGAFAVGVTYGMGSRDELASADALCDTPAEVAQTCLRIVREA